MAIHTKRAIMRTFQQMLEEIPFDKITVSALVRRCEISSNTFYYHYQDIYQLLDLWISNELSRFVPGEDSEFTDWKLATKALMRDCREHSRIIYHIFNSISRDRLERYVFTLTDDAFFQVVRRIAGDQLAEETALEIAAFCRYAYIGFFMQFLWNRMQSDIDESVDRLGVLFDGFVEAPWQGQQKTPTAERGDKGGKGGADDAAFISFIPAASSASPRLRP